MLNDEDDDEDDDEDEDDDDEDEADDASLELLRFPPFPDGDGLLLLLMLWDEVLSLLTPDEVEDKEPFLSKRPLRVVVCEEIDSCFCWSREEGTMLLLASVGGLVSCMDVLELLPLELPGFPLWWEEL